MRRVALILTVTAAAMLWAGTALAQTVREGDLLAGCRADWTQVSLNGNDSLDGGAGTDSKVTDNREAKIVGFP